MSISEGTSGSTGNGATPPPNEQAEVLLDAKITAKFKRGDNDDAGSRIDDIFWVTDRFVIYEAEGQVRYTLPDDYGAAKTLRRRIADLCGLRASIEHLRADKAISSGEKKRAAREIAWALADAFEDDSTPPSEKPREVLSRVDARLRSLVKSAYRRKFVLANLTAFGLIEALLVALAVALYAFDSAAAQVVQRYALFGAMGGLGAFLSVMIGIRDIDVDLDLKGWEHVFSGATRIFIGVIGAWVVVLALHSSFIDPTFGFGASADGTSADLLTGKVDQQLAMYLILTFIAGFSESLVPNLLQRGEHAAGGGKQTTEEPIVERLHP